jgi:hypothetical protein
MLFRRAWFFCLVVISAQTNPLEAADKTASTLLVKDALTVPGRPATIEARLDAKGLLTAGGLGGEPLELVVDGKVVATGMTGGDGRAFLTYSTKAQGVIAMQVRVGASSRVLPTGGEANLAVWERRTPIVAIELAALTQKPSAQSPFPAIGLKREPERKPMPDAADELAKLTRFYYRVIYLAVLPTSDADAFRAAAEARDWLKANKFPPGYVLALPPGESALGAKIDELHAAGWKNLKTGIGRSKPFAETFLRRRLEAVMVPEPAKGEVPRKAKTAKDWKELRKKL